MQSLPGLETKVSALYIDRKGPYPLILGDDRCWDELRDARLYAGAGPVIAHPLVGRGGSFASSAHYSPVTPARSQFHRSGNMGGYWNTQRGQPSGSIARWPILDACLIGGVASASK